MAKATFFSVFFASDDALIGNGQPYSNFKYIYPTFYIVHPQTLDELSFVELIKGIIFIEVII